MASPGEGEEHFSAGCLVGNWWVLVSLSSSIIFRESIHPFNSQSSPVKQKQFVSKVESIKGKIYYGIMAQLGTHAFYLLLFCLLFKDWFSYHWYSLGCTFGLGDL